MPRKNLTVEFEIGVEPNRRWEESSTFHGTYGCMKNLLSAVRQHARVFRLNYRIKQDGKIVRRIKAGTGAVSDVTIERRVKAI